jgi:hypothetical protein
MKMKNRIILTLLANNCSKFVASLILAHAFIFFFLMSLPKLIIFLLTGLLIFLILIILITISFYVSNVLESFLDKVAFYLFKDLLIAIFEIQAWRRKKKKFKNSKKSLTNSLLKAAQLLKLAYVFLFKKLDASTKEGNMQIDKINADYYGLLKVLQGKYTIDFGDVDESTIAQIQDDAHLAVLKKYITDVLIDDKKMTEENILSLFDQMGKNMIAYIKYGDCLIKERKNQILEEGSGLVYTTSGNQLSVSHQDICHLITAKPPKQPFTVDYSLKLTTKSECLSDHLLHPVTSTTFPGKPKPHIEFVVSLKENEHFSRVLLRETRIIEILATPDKVTDTVDVSASINLIQYQCYKGSNFSFTAGFVAHTNFHDSFHYGFAIGISLFN